MQGNLSEEADFDIAPGVLTIDLAALRQNYRALQRRLGSTPAAAVVKADAYGLGANRVVPALYNAGCRNFFVAQLSEALALRPMLGDDARLFVLNGLQPHAETVRAQSGIIPVLNSLEQVANWSDLGSRLGRTLPALLQIDTGMSRLGLAVDEVRALAADPARLAGVRLLYVMSHLASADEPESAQNDAQLEAMRCAAATFPGIEVCFANSGGIFLGPEYHGALARPGIALYGGAPTAGASNPMAPVVRLAVRVIQTRMVPAGTRVGYGGAHVTATERRLATIAAGYADGLPRSLSERGAAFFGDARLPITGRVSMDSLTLDVSALPPGTLRLGSFVELIGPYQTLEDLAATAGTISYEILTALGRRYHRVYR